MRTRPTQVPVTALGPAIPKVGYLVEEIGDQLFSVSDGLYQMMFLVTDDGVIAVDAPPTLGANVARAIASVSSLPVTDAVYSHHHADHVGAMVLYDGATLHAQHETARLLHQVADPNRPQHRTRPSQTPHALNSAAEYSSSTTTDLSTPQATPSSTPLTSRC